jgi:Emfourin
MQITVIKSGGIEGVREELGPVDIETLADDLRTEIEEELQRVDFEEMPSEPPPHDRRPDGFGYVIEVVDGDRSHQVECDDAEMRGLESLLGLLDRAGSWHSKPWEQGG